jgi:hypothetical protein
MMIGGSHGNDYEYFIYISGDVGRSVQISYLGREILDTPTNDLPEGNDTVFINYGRKNVYFTENVKLPFSTQISYLYSGNEDEGASLTIVSENDSTTRAIIFDIGSGLVLADSVCGVYAVWWTANAQGECSYCKDLSKDSVLNYLRDIHYPCYLEFSKGETVKEVRLTDWWQRD